MIPIEYSCDFIQHFANLDISQRSEFVTSNKESLVVCEH